MPRKPKKQHQPLGFISSDLHEMKRDSNISKLGSQLHGKITDIQAHFPLNTR